MTERPAACQAIIEAAQELGLEYRADVNNLPPGAGAEHRLVPADPRRQAPRQRRADLPEAGGEARPTCRSSPTRWCTA